MGFEAFSMPVLGRRHVAGGALTGAIFLRYAQLRPGRRHAN